MAPPGMDNGLCARVSLDEYVERMPEGQRDIYYLVAPGGRKQAGIVHSPLPRSCIHFAPALIEALIEASAAELTDAYTRSG